LRRWLQPPPDVPPLRQPADVVHPDLGSTTWS